MSRFSIFMILILCPAVALGQGGMRWQRYSARPRALQSLFRPSARSGTGLSQTPAGRQILSSLIQAGAANLNNSNQANRQVVSNLLQSSLVQFANSTGISGQVVLPAIESALQNFNRINGSGGYVLSALLGTGARNLSGGSPGVVSPLLGAMPVEGLGSGVLPPERPFFAPSAFENPAGWGGGDWGYGGYPQTAISAALHGQADVIRAAGQYNQATSLAAINMTVAQSNALRNQVQQVETFYEMRKIGRAERELERGPRPTPEEYARRAHAAAPRPLTTHEMDPASGVLYWPASLQHESFEPQRTTLEDLTLKWAKYGALDFDERVQVRQAIDIMYGKLRAQIASMPPQDYVDSRSFLSSLLYTTTRALL